VQSALAKPADSNVFANDCTGQSKGLSAVVGGSEQ